MPDTLRLARAAMKALVQSFGCYDAVASTIHGRFGIPVSRGTISKKMSGHLEFTLPDIIALQEAAGRHPVTDILSRQRANQPDDPGDNLINHGASITKECGEASVATLRAAQAARCADTRAEARNEIAEAINALNRADARLASLDHDEQ